MHMMFVLGCESVGVPRVVLAVVRSADPTVAMAGIKEFLEIALTQLKDLTALVRTKLTKLGKKTMGALLVMEVHARDMVTRFIDKGVESQADFEWLSQLRYYWYDEIIPTSPGLDSSA